MKQLFKEKRYERITETMIRVDSHTVKEQIKKGRTILLCDCDNDSRFGNINICRHKLFYLYLPLFEEINSKIDKMELKYKGADNINQKVNAFWMLDDLEELR